MRNKLILGLLAIAAISWSCSNSDNSVRDEARESLQSVTVNNPDFQGTVATGPVTSIQFEESDFNFGTVDEGAKIEHKYQFTNTGNEPLLITNAKGSCGCTVGDYPQTPVAPGETAEVTVTLNTTGKKNAVRQSVTLTANTEPANTVIYISGNVTPKVVATN